MRLFEWFFLNIFPRFGNSRATLKKQYDTELLNNNTEFKHYNGGICKNIINPNVSEFDGYLLVNGKSIILPFVLCRADNVEISENGVTIKINNNGTMWETFIKV